MSDQAEFRANVVLSHFQKEKVLGAFYVRLLTQLFQDSDLSWSLDEVRRAGNLLVVYGQSPELARHFVTQMEDRFSSYVRVVNPLSLTVERMFGQTRRLAVEVIFYALIAVNKRCGQDTCEGLTEPSLLVDPNEFVN